MAELFVAWAKPPHSYLFVHFARILLSTLNSCFKSKKNIRDEKEHMWTRYHILRCSPNFHDAWQNFMSHSIKTEAQPSFYQHVSQTVFTKLIGLRYVAAESSENSSPVQKTELTNIEENVLRYLAGYLCNKIQKQLEKTNKYEQLLVVSDMSGCEMNDGKDTESWTNIMDRGGLWHVNDTTFQMVCSMEMELRNHLSVKKAVLAEQNTASFLVEKLAGNEEVKIHWQTLCEDHTVLDTDEKDQLLHMFTKLFVTIRGFAFATSLIETYKKVSGKTLQKTKGLRKTINNH